MDSALDSVGGQVGRAFRTLTEDTVVWERGDKSWRV